MALKPDRYEMQTDISYFCNDVTERGVILVHSSSGSGASLDNKLAIVALSTGSVGLKPAGLLLNDIVNVDLTRYTLNRFKDEMQVGGKCTLLRKGWVVTNKVTGTPVAGDKAYLANSGLVTPSTGGPQVGVFLGAKDEKGYVKVEISLPGVT